MLCEVGASVGSSQVSSGIHINAKAQGFPAELVMLMISVYLRLWDGAFSQTHLVPVCGLIYLFPPACVHTMHGFSRRLP